MKKILTILFCLLAFSSFAQDSLPYMPMRANYNYFRHVAVRGTLSFKTVCGAPTLDSATKKMAALAFDSCNAKLYVYNPKTQAWTTVNDSTTFVPYNEYGIKSGGEVRRLTGNDYEITTVYYTIEGVNYRALTDTVTLNSYADSAQVAGIFANTAQVISVRYSAKSSQPVFPPPVPTEEVLVAYVLISDTGNVIYTPSVDSNWVRDGDNLLNANPGNVILNDIYFIDGGVQKRIFVANNQLWLQSNRTTGSKILLGTVGGNISVSTNEVEISGGDNSGTSGTKSALTISGRLLNASGTEAYNFISSSPTINKTGGTGDISFIKYNPTLTLVTGEHYFLNSSAGRVKLGGLGTSIDTTTYKPTGMDIDGNIIRMSSWPIGSGGGGSQTLQLTFDNGTTLNKNNTILGAGHNLSFQRTAIYADSLFRNAIDYGGVEYALINDPDGDGIEMHMVDPGAFSRNTVPGAISASEPAANFQTVMSVIGIPIIQSANVSAGGSTTTVQFDTTNISINTREVFFDTPAAEDTVFISIQNPPIAAADPEKVYFEGSDGRLTKGDIRPVISSIVSDSTKNFYVYSPLVVRDTTDGYVVEIDADSLATWRPVSGTYFPEFTEVLNIDSLYDSYKFFYSRNGDIVTVSGYMFLVTGSAGDQGIFTIELPIPSNLTDLDDINGICTTSNPSATGGFYVNHDSLNPGVVNVGFSTLSSGDDLPINIIFTYIIK